MLPVEILENVIANLCRDRPSLHSCSLVARMWLHLARAHFFHVVLTPINVDEFVELASRTCAFIGETLQGLAVTRNWDAIQVPAFPPMEKVSCLVIHNMDYSSTLHVVLQALPSITHLDLDQVNVAAFTELTSIVSQFLSLQSLSLCDISWEEYQLSDHRLPNTLVHLSLTECYQRDIFDWLLYQSPIPVVPDLNLGISVSPSDAPAIGQYLAHVGSALRSLRFGFSSFDAGGDAEDFLTSVHLDLNAGLTNLWFDEFIGEREFAQVTTCGAWIVEILRQVSSLDVVSFGIKGGIDDAEIDWAILDEQLMRLEVGIVRFLGASDDFESFSVNLRKRLPQCERKQIIKFEA